MVPVVKTYLMSNKTIAIWYLFLTNLTNAFLFTNCNKCVKGSLTNFDNVLIVCFS